MYRRILNFSFFLILASLLSRTSNAQIIIDGFTDATNDRFTNSSSFVGAGFDLTGIGNGAGWSTLISNNVIITANHSRATGISSFYESNDPNPPSINRSVGPGQRIGTTDLYLAVLDSPLPPSIKFYDFATEAISAPPFDPDTNPGFSAAGSFQNENAFLFGVSPTVRTNAREDQAVGRNRISGYLEDLPFTTGPLAGTESDFLILLNDAPSDPDFVQHEALLQGGDSGAPFFVEVNGELQLLGINSFNGATGDGTQLSGISYIGNYADEINAFISANAVPEPGVLGVGLIAMIGLSTRRRRSLAS